MLELLIVIAVIAVLISILLPALGKAKAMAKRSGCQSNLRQWAVNFSLYNSDFDGWLPVAYSSFSAAWPSGGWASCIEVVMDKKYSDYKLGEGNDFGIWKCPENISQSRPMSTSGNPLRNSYQPNGWDGFELYLETCVAWHKKPSALHALYDGAYFRNEPWNNDGKNTEYSIGMRSVRYAHAKGLNMLYADGHSKWLPPILEYRGPHTGGGGAAAFTNGWSWYCR